MQSALIVVDMQRDFIDGSLPVPGAAKIVPYVNASVGIAVAREWPVIYTRDWHPAESRHFRTWPVHCVQGSDGADWAQNLLLIGYAPIISKGVYLAQEGYSGFEGEEITGQGRMLVDILHEMKVESLYVCGLALDHCVKATALDGRKYGFEVSIVANATAAVDVDSAREAMAAFRTEGVTQCLVSDLLR